MSVHLWDWQTPAPEACRGAVLALGNFDGVHRGHADLMGRLQAMARRLATFPMAVTFDPHPLHFLAPGADPIPLAALSRRCEWLQQAGASKVLILKVTPELLQLSPEFFFHEVLSGKLHARGFVEGPNFAFGKDRAGTPQVLQTLCEASGLPLEIAAPMMQDGDIVSSSRIRQAIMAGDVRLAERLLGRPHEAEGVVGRGASRGQRIGFPTANLEGITTLLPPIGVYAAWGEMEGERWPAAINLGPNPTFAEHHDKVEAHLIGFQGSLFGRPLRLGFLDRLRNVTAFPSVEALQQQLKQDIAAAQAIFQSNRSQSSAIKTVAAPQELRQRVEVVLNSTLRPILQDTGGNVILVDITEDKVARISLQGTCRGCPSTVMSIIMGIESELRDMVPEIAYLEVIGD